MHIVMNTQINNKTLRSGIFFKR